MEDCYYFLYSSCSKKNTCAFRHNKESKENPILCKNWKTKKTCRIDCPFRHSTYHLNKNRSDMFCYWETQEGGCTKVHCEFKHMKETKDAWKGIRIKTLDEIKSEMLQEAPIKEEKIFKEEKILKEIPPKKIIKTDLMDEIDKELEEIDELLKE